MHNDEEKKLQKSPVVEHFLSTATTITLSYLAKLVRSHITRYPTSEFHTEIHREIVYTLRAGETKFARNCFYVVIFLDRIKKKSLL